MPEMDRAERAVAVRGSYLGAKAKAARFQLNDVRRPRGRRHSHALLWDGLHSR
jgi:hypothetical protein